MRRSRSLLPVIGFTLGVSFCGSAAQSPPAELLRSSTGSIVNGDVSLRYLLERPPGLGDLSSDMAAGAAFLRTLPDVDRTRIGLVGPSQAGWIIPVAAKRSHPAFMILLVGPTVTVGQEIRNAWRFSTS